MEKTKENLELLNKIGFKNTDDDWFEHIELGWVFNLQYFDSFSDLTKRMIAYNAELEC